MYYFKRSDRTMTGGLSKRQFVDMCHSMRWEPARIDASLRFLPLEPSSADPLDPAPVIWLQSFVSWYAGATNVARNLLSAFDVDGDKKLDLDELSALCAALPGRVTEKNVEFMMQQGDRQQAGGLDADDLSAMMRKICAGGGGS